MSSFARSASLSSGIAEALPLWFPPPRPFLDVWADKNYRLSRESSSKVGEWECLPYQREILRCMGDPMIECVSVEKSARTGLTKCLNIVVAYHLSSTDPAAVMVMQPTLVLAQRYSKKEIAPMLRDMECLRGVVASANAKDSSNTILEKLASNGASLMMIGSVSASDLSSVSIRILLCDETDRYVTSAGDEGDPVELAVQRTGYFWNRKIIKVSTPVNEGESQIEAAFLQGDQRRYFVPCPWCDHFDVLTMFKDDAGGGHWLNWPEGKPEAAHFVCSSCAKPIEHDRKQSMVARGEWRAGRPYEETLNPATGRGHASFHVWAAYSASPNATWGNIAREYLRAEAAGPLKLKTYWNTTLGRTWRVPGDAPKWEELWKRRIPMDRGSFPSPVEYITIGVDVQGDGLPWEAVGWSASQQSWSLGTGKILGDTSTTSSPVWDELDKLLDRTWQGTDGRTLGSCQLAIDSGFHTQQVYAWARRHDKRRVMVVKGDGNPKADRVLLSSSGAEVNVNGVVIPNGVDVWHVAVSLLKEEFYGWLNLPAPGEGEAYPNGWCHFPDHEEDYFKEITAEQRVMVRKPNGETVPKWMLIPKRENHRLDCRNYARAAAVRWGIDRLTPRTEAAPAKPTQPPAPKRNGWLTRRGDDRPWLR